MGLNLSSNAVKVGEQVTLSASVGGIVTPTGTVTFFDDSTPLGTATLVDGAATFSTSALALGSHAIAAIYNGDSNFLPNGTSAELLTVAKGDTTLAVSSLPAAGRAGQPIVLKSTLSVTAPAAGTPTGSVIFKQGSRTLGTGTIASGVAQASVSGLKVGSHAITAHYSGDTNFNTSSISATVQVKAGLGDEAKVNTFTDGAQQYPSIAKTRNGYVIVWASNEQDGDRYGVYGQRYNNNAVAQGPEFHVNVETKRNQTLPKVAGLTGGTFIAVWQTDAQDGSGWGIYGRSFTASGTARAEFKVNNTTEGAQSAPAIAPLSDGGFAIAWAGPSGIYAQRFDDKAKPAGTEFKVNTTSGSPAAPTIAAVGDGFVVAWQGEDDDGLGIFAQRYDSVGAKAGREIAINRTKLGDQSLPSVAGIDGGTFVVAWQSANQDGSDLGIYAQRFSGSGAREGGEIRINTMMANAQSQPQVSAFDDGGFAVLWTSDLQDGSGKGVYAQVFTSGGTKVDAEFLVNTTTVRDQSQATVAAASAGNFMAAWTSRGAAETVTDIYMQRFKVPLGD